jgi:hypothetical protein
LLKRLLLGTQAKMYESEVPSIFHAKFFVSKHFAMVFLVVLQVGSGLVHRHMVSIRELLLLVLVDPVDLLLFAQNLLVVPLHGLVPILLSSLVAQRLVSQANVSIFVIGLHAQGLV